MTKFYKVPSSQALPLVPLPGLSWISSEAQLAGRDRCHIPRACLGLCPFSETPLARRPLRGRRPLHPLCGSLPLPGPRLKQCWGVGAIPCEEGESDSVRPPLSLPGRAGVCSLQLPWKAPGPRHACLRLSGAERKKTWVYPPLGRP